MAITGSSSYPPERLKLMNEDVTSAASTDIAIIGYAARFPGAENAARFWENLRQGVESIQPFSVQELESVGVSAAALRDPDYVRVGAPLTQLDGFDAGFFGISPRDAAIMDPQQRLFMESAWEALEHAGYAPGTFSESTGVFAGSGPNSYLIYNVLRDPELVAKEGLFLLRHTGNDKDVLATRLSYQMNLRGPSLSVQTACSTSLVAVHLACQSLLHLDCSMAVAGAVSIEIPHAIGYQYRQNEIQSHDGHCRAFDASATGTVFGSGLGIVILRRLEDALAAGDTIHAVIKGTAVNNDGSRKVGFLAPSTEGQVEVILEALGAAGVEPGTIDYVETHGTGTPIGDPIELSALDQVFAKRDRKLRIGSVKTNIGHLDTAAGMAGLLKTVLALKNKQIPATLHFKTLNPLIDEATTKLEVVDRLTDWKATGNAPRRAGVTSLGIGGTNAHVILEEPPEPAPGESSRPVKLLTLSAKSATALEDATQALASHLERHPRENLDDIAYTLHCGRAGFGHRRAFVVRDHADAVRLASQPDSSGVATAQVAALHPVAFLFTGQGSQYVHMGAELYRNEPVFKQWIDACAAKALPHLGLDFRDILYPSPAGETRAVEEIKLTWNAQPILFAFEYALARLWISWGVVPDKLIGHSLGEYTAACLSGVFTLDDAIALVCARGALMKKVGAGAMLAVPRAETEVDGWLEEGLSLAAVNGPRQCVVSGPTDAIVALEKKLSALSVPSQRLETSHAFHSALLDPILDAFTEMVATKSLHAPQIPIVSNVTGMLLTETEATSPAYWARHMRGTVRFYDGLKLLQAEPAQFLIEVGPGATLSALARQSAANEARGKVLSSLSRSEKITDLASMFSALGQLWLHGVSIDWKAFHAQERRRRIPVPTYSFQRKHAWLGPRIGSNWLVDTFGKLDDWFYRSSWKEAPLTEAVSSTAPCLVLADATGEKLIAELRKAHGEIIAVTAGEKFAAVAENTYILNPSSLRDYSLLFDHLARHDQVPRHVVHLWGLEPSGASEDRCFHSLVYLIQTLGSRLPDAPIAITAVSHRSVSIHREPVLHPYGSLLIGPCRVAPLEYPTLRCRQVDVDSTEPAELAALILKEGESDAAASLAVYRDGIRWIQGIERFHPEPSGADRLREKGTYLITGGLGGLGMAVADWLARTHRARLILLSRHAEPDAAQTRQFAEWLELGAEVLVVAADVTDRAAFQAALTQAREKFGAIHGIVHAAGVLQDGIIQLKKKDAARKVLAPKTVGVEILDELTRGEPLDFFALFSSVSALTPPDGQVDYCAANAFLNAFAHSQPAERNFIVIGWGRWAEVGMVVPKTGVPANAEPFRHPLIEGTEFDTAARTIYSGTLSVERNWVLGEHHFHGGDSLLPGTAYLEIAVSALWKKIGKQSVALENVVFLAPLRVAPNSPVAIHAELRKAGAGYQFSVTANAITYVSGACRPSPGRAPRINLAEIRRRCPDQRDEPRNIRQRGHFDFGPRWDSLRQVAFGADECLGLVELPAEYRSETKSYSLHPALLDIATGVAMYVTPGYEQPGDLLLPFAYKRMTVYGVLPPRVYSHARMRPGAGADLVVFDITLAGESGEVVAEIDEFTVKRLRSVADLAHLEIVPPAPVETPAGISTREGLEAFRRVLKSRNSDMVFVSPTELSTVALMREGGRLGDSVTASSDDVNLVVEQLWRSLLGLEEVDAKTDFFDSGGNSLLAIRLFADIRKRFNVNFGISVLFEARTAGALAELIREARAVEAVPKAVTVGNTVVPIREGESKTPLFLIHDVNGDVIRYEQLARHFPGGQAVYAIEPLGLRGGALDFSVPDMARHYIQQIRERQPHGPYFVAGHSFGGAVAYEIACQLTEQGETMGVVGLFDTYQENVEAGDNLLQAARYRKSKALMLKLLARHIYRLIVGQNRIGYFSEKKNVLLFRIGNKVTRARYRIAYKLHTRYGWAMPPALNDVKEANWIASDYYRPAHYQGNIILFRAKDRIKTDPPDSSRLWRRLIGNGLVILDVPGDHNSILNEPGAQILAEHLLKYLKSNKAALAESQKTS